MACGAERDGEIEECNDEIPRSGRGRLGEWGNFVYLYVSLLKFVL